MMHITRVIARIAPLFALLAGFSLRAQTAASLIPGPDAPFLDTSTGQALPCVNCTLSTFAAGTSTPARTYTDYTLTTQNSTVITLDSAGYSPSGIWTGSAVYKFVLKSAQGATLRTQDHVSSAVQDLRAALAASSGASLIGYKLPATGSATTNVAAKLNSFYEAVADFGADNTNATDTTAAAQAAVSAALTAGTCAHFIGGTYKVSYSSVASITLPSNACMRGDGPNQSILLQNTNAGTTLAVTGNNAVIRDLFVGKEVSVTGGTGISLYPDVSSSTQVAYTVIENVAIEAAYCNNDPTNACEAGANGNRLTYGLLIQSGVKDNLFNHFDNSYVRWATYGIYAIGSGLTGSSGVGAVNANWYTNDYIADVANCIAFISSGESFFPGLQCTDASASAVLFKPQTAGFYSGGQSSNNKGDVQGEASTALADFSNAASYTSSHCSQSNIIVAAYNEISSGTAGNVSVLGDCQSENEIRLPGIVKSGFYFNSGTPTNSVDPFFCTGMIDDYTSRCTATVDHRSTTNIQNIFRFRNGPNTATSSDFVNWNPFSGGFAFKTDSTFSGSLPMATWIGPGTATSVSQLLNIAAGPNVALWSGQYWNSGSSTATANALEAFTGSPGSQTQIHGWWVTGNGMWGPSNEMTVAQLNATVPCNTTLLSAGGAANAFVAINNLLTPALGSAPVGGGSVHGTVHCNGSGFTVAAL